MTKALIIVDLQNDFVTGSLTVPGAEQVAKRIHRHLLQGDLLADYVVTTQDWHVDPGDHFTEWPKHCQANTPGAELVDEIKDLPFEARFRKGQYGAGYSGFDGEAYGAPKSIMLKEWLTEHGVTEVDIIGIALDHCVKATALDAVKAGFETCVLRPWTAYVDAKSAEEALIEMHQAGVRIME